MKALQLVDSHCHLDFPEFEGELDDVITRAGDAGVDYMVTICTRVSEFERILGLARRFENMWCSVGIHPHNAGDEPPIDAEKLIGLAEDPKVIGFGETGLDFFYENSPRDRQEESFRIHIAAARETGLPVIVHTRDADEDMLRILEGEYRNGAFPGLIHCFSSGSELAERVLDIGFYISLSGIVTFKKAEELRETVKIIPMERILVETDSPYLAPVPKRGKRNEPSYTAHTANCIAELRGMDPEKFAHQTTENFFRLFGKANAETSPCD